MMNNISHVLQCDIIRYRCFSPSEPAATKHRGGPKKNKMKKRIKISTTQNPADIRRTIVQLLNDGHSVALSFKDPKNVTKKFLDEAVCSVKYYSKKVSNIETIPWNIGTDVICHVHQGLRS